MTSYTLTELHDKRAELAGEILQAEKRARELRADLAHVEAATRILRPGTELPKVVPKRVEFRPRYFKGGQLTRSCLDYIRTHAGEPIAVADILPLAIDGRSLTQAEHASVRTAVHQALHKIEKRGTIERIASEGARYAAANILIVGRRHACARWRVRRCARYVSSGASRTSYAAGLRANWNPNLDARGEDTTFCPTRTQRQERRSPRRAVRVRTTDPVRTSTRKHWSPAEQIRYRAPG